MDPLIIHKLSDWRSSEIYVLREDLIPIGCGGNKVRIVERLLEDARAKGADTIVGYGNSRSNLCRVLAMLCARDGLACVIISPCDTDGSRVDTTNSRIVRMCGAKVVACEKGDSVSSVVEDVMNGVSCAGGHPYYVFGDRFGNGNEKVLSSAYEDVAAQICEWEVKSGIRFDRIVVAVGTGSTYAGLLNGFCSRMRNVPVTGFSIAREKEVCLKALGRFTQRPCDVRSSALAGGYGKVSENLARFIAAAVKKYAIVLDPVYSGKALWGLYDCILSGAMSGERILFVHTGSLPLAIDGLGEING